MRPSHVPPAPSAPPTFLYICYARPRPCPLLSRSGLILIYCARGTCRESSVGRGGSCVQPGTLTYAPNTICDIPLASRRVANDGSAAGVGEGN